MSDGIFHVPHPVNETVRSYAPGDAQRASLKARLKSMAAERIEIPCVIGGKEVRTGTKRQVVMPHSHREVLADFHVPGQTEMRAAVDAAMKAKPAWEAMRWQDRVGIFLKAADLLAGPYRDLLNSATMLGQSKNAYQAEIDSACELIDFLRFNPYFYQQILGNQPISSPGIWNRVEYRPLDGFVLAVTPFNFTAIAGNLPTAPAMVGNTVIWKPANTQMLAAHYLMQLFREAGLPDGVINLVPAAGAEIGKTLLPMKELAGVHFTGSTATFNSIWKTVSDNIDNYGCYPRLVGETGGKDFVFAHPSADVDALVTALVRGSFEYQGQKCSAASRAYLPRSLWKAVEERLVEAVKSIRMGDVRDFRNFVNAVIDKSSFENISGYLNHAKDSADAKILVGGKANMDKGYFVEPTVIVASRPDYKSMVEEIFGPVLTVYVYDDNKLDEALKACDECTPYALTGAIFAQDRYAVDMMTKRLRGAAGNFYINDKPTGAVVGQQPFGGSRASGTNDKAGSSLNLVRWLSPRSIKETFVPVKGYGYPFMGEE
ncbi:MAG: L-glutamate gamma-semialdehyde dehydrogenase [Oligoflexia bacterium]|nr:L-glutamate gamma-semialdehyde dehydrogenase [Oligoflexia bacterium]